jgi:hypothetical protein
LAQTRGAPDRQLPPLQESSIEQGLPSLHEPVALVRVQVPVAGSQASIVQALPSSQLPGGWEH